MGDQRNVDVGLAKEVEKDWKHLLLSIVVLLEPREVDDVLQNFSLFVTKVRQQVIVVIANYRREKARHHVVGNFDLQLVHRVTDDRLPYVVIDLI